MNNEKVIALLRHPAVIPTAVGVVAFAGGSVAGYLFGRKMTENEIDERAEILENATVEGAEILENATVEADRLLEDAREAARDIEDLAAAKFNKESAKAEREALYEGNIDTSEIDYSEAPDVLVTTPQGDPGTLVVDEEAKELLESLINEHGVEEGGRLYRESIHQGRDEIEDEEEPPTTHNVFAGNDDDWDYGEELANRTDTQPYIIHKDEFYVNEKGYEQKSLTYYNGDDIMTDELDTPIYNHNEYTGPLKFGHGSQDPAVVYIRNDVTKMEYEVLLYNGHFAVVVKGLEADTELENTLSHGTRIRRFRPDD